MTSPAPSYPTSTTLGSSCLDETSPDSSPPPPSPDPPSNRQTPETEGRKKTSPLRPLPNKFLEPVWSPADDESVTSSPYYDDALSWEGLNEVSLQWLASYQRFATVRTPLPKEAPLGLWLGGGYISL